MSSTNGSHRGRDRQLAWSLAVCTASGESSVAHVLLDTRTEVNLMRRALFFMDDLTPAKFPVSLETVNGEPIGGGDLMLSLSFDLFARECGSDAVYTHYHHR